MLDLMITGLLEQLEETSEFIKIREKIIDDRFEKNANDYIEACEIFHQTAEEYFKLGFKSCLTTLKEIQQTYDIKH